MWSVSEREGKYVVTDHNGDEQARIPMEDGISTSDVREVMHDRAGTLKSQLSEYSGNRPVPVGDIIEWMTITEDMAGNNIELPSGDG